MYHSQTLSVSLSISCVLDSSRGAGAQMCDCKRDWLWVRSPLDEVEYSLKKNVFISFPLVQNAVLSSATRLRQGKRSVLILGLLCLSCCVRHTA